MATPTLLDRIRQDMQLRRLAPSTQEAYLDAVTGVAAFCARSPNAFDSLMEDELFLHLVEDRHASRSTVLQRRVGLRFVVAITLRRTWPVLDLVRPAECRTLPVVLPPHRGAEAPGAGPRSPSADVPDDDLWLWPPTVGGHRPHDTQH